MSRSRAFALWICLPGVAGAACRPHAPRPELVREVDAPAAAATTVPTGATANGAWNDARFPWSVHVPAGWEVVAGTEGTNPRLTLVHQETRARVEVSVLPGGTLGPRPRRGCSWAFEDTGGYRALIASGPVKVATCTPEDARDARVLGYFLEEGGVAYDIEAVLPPGRLVDGKDVTDAIVGGFRLRSESP